MHFLGDYLWTVALSRIETLKVMCKIYRGHSQNFSPTAKFNFGTQRSIESGLSLSLVSTPNRGCAVVC